MILRILPILLLTLILPDTYLYFRLIRGKKRSWPFRILLFLPGILMLAVALTLALTESHAPENLTRIIIFFNFYMLIALPKTVFMLADLAGKGISLILPGMRKLCTAVSAAASLLLLGIMGIGILFGPSRLQVRHAEFSSPDLPQAFNGYRIVQLSDMHLTSFRSRPEMVEKIVERVMEQHPDMIVFTGDLVSSHVDELNGFEEILSRMHAPNGVYSVMGNHDYLTYARYLTPQQQAKACQELMDRQRSMNWDLLLNEHRIIRKGTDSIALAGVENDGNPPFPEHGDLKKALNGIPGYGTDTDNNSMFKILLSHDPTHWRRKVLPQTDIQLTLSGHTHGMQFMLFEWSPSRYFYPEWKHMYLEGTRGLYVSLGLGGALIPFRFGAWPEINVITLHSK